MNDELDSRDLLCRVAVADALAIKKTAIRFRLDTLQEFARQINAGTILGYIGHGPYPQDTDCLIAHWSNAMIQNGELLAVAHIRQGRYGDTFLRMTDEGELLGVSMSAMGAVQRLEIDDEFVDEVGLPAKLYQIDFATPGSQAMPAAHVLRRIKLPA